MDKSLLLNNRCQDRKYIKSPESGMICNKIENHRKSPLLLSWRHSNIVEGQMSEWLKKINYYTSSQLSNNYKSKEIVNHIEPSLLCKV